jgi:hypothetical protein
MGLSGLLPIIHAAVVYPWASLTQQAGLGYYLVEGLSLITGTFFYVVSLDNASIEARMGESSLFSLHGGRKRKEERRSIMIFFCTS